MLFKFICAALFIQLLSLSCFAQQPDCRSLHKGSFKTYSEGSGTTYITRTATEQTETNDEMGAKAVFTVKWIDDCTYELRPKVLIKGDPSIMGNAEAYVRTKIISIGAKNYTAEITSSFFSGTVECIVDVIH